MPFDTVKKIGRPGKPGKWQQPNGTRLYRWTWTNDSAGMTGGATLLLRQDQFGDSNAIIKTITSPGSGFYTPENTIIVIETMKAEIASRSWSGSPANPRVELRANDAGKGFNGDVLKTDSLIESIDCTTANRNIALALQGKRAWAHNGSYDFGPEFYVRSYHADRPTSFVTCKADFKITALILLPKNGVSSTPVQNGTLTLIKET